MNLYITYCAKNKRDGVLPPDVMYISGRIQRFTSSCNQKGFNWAILSAKYGLFFPEENREKYDVTFKSSPPFWLGTQVVVNEKGLPRNNSDIALKDLATVVAAQIRQRHVDQIFYYYEPKGPYNPPKGYLALVHFVMDNCTQSHTWSDLVNHIAKNGAIHTITKI